GTAHFLPAAGAPSPALAVPPVLALGRGTAPGNRPHLGSPSAPHDLLRDAVGRHLHRDHRPRGDHERPLTPDYPTDPHRPVAGPGRSPPVLRPGPHPELGRSRHRLGQGRAPLQGLPGHHLGGTGHDRTEPVRTGRTHDHTGRLGTRGHGPRHPLLAGPHLCPDRAVPTAQHRSGHHERVPGGLLNHTRRGAAHGPGLRQARRRTRRGTYGRTWAMMASAGTELDAAGIGAHRLREDYLRCRALHAHHGRTYYTATRVLPAERRPAIHALYGFARWVDDIVDEPTPETTMDEQRARLDAIDIDLGRALAGKEPNEPVL